MAGGCGAAALDAGGDILRRREAAGSLENRVYAIPTAISSRIWSGRKRSRGGMHLGG
jgi:hypothetical protein